MDEWERRRLFNEVERILERVSRGELTVAIIAISYNIDSTNEPPGTVGQMLSYRDPANNGFEVCRAYCYRRPDGSFGGSGRRLPDPKKIYHDGIIYVEPVGGDND